MVNDKLKNQKEDCIFCKIANKEIKDEIIYESDNFIVVPDLHPVGPGHCLIISKRHYETVLDLPSSLGGELLDVAKKQGFRFMKDEKAEGFNLFQNNFEAGGQVVMHYHLHAIPRRKGVKLLR